MCIGSDLVEFKCSFYPGTGSCIKTLRGERKKKCPDGFSEEVLKEKLEKAQDGHKICEGRRVNKSLIRSR